MKNTFCLDLVLPVTIDLSEFNRIKSTDIDCTIINHFNLSPDKNLNKFLKKYSLEICHSEVFYTPPYTKTVGIHIDSENIASQTKINYVFGASGSRMQWFTPKDSTIVPALKKTVIDSYYYHYNDDQCDLIYSAKVEQPSMVEVGVAHDVVNNTNDPRWCLSFMMYDPYQKIRPSWADVHERLREFVVH
jgi:hypothetical protein